MGGGSYMDRMSDKDGIFMGKFKGHCVGCRGGNKALKGFQWDLAKEVEVPFGGHPVVVSAWPPAGTPSPPGDRVSH